MLSLFEFNNRWKLLLFKIYFSRLVIDQGCLSLYWHRTKISSVLQFSEFDVGSLLLSLSHLLVSKVFLCFSSNIWGLIIFTYIFFDYWYDCLMLVFMLAIIDRLLTVTVMVMCTMIIFFLLLVMIVTLWVLMFMVLIVRVSTTLMAPTFLTITMWMAISWVKHFNHD